MQSEAAGRSCSAWNSYGKSLSRDIGLESQDGCRCGRSWTVSAGGIKPNPEKVKNFLITLVNKVIKISFGSFYYPWLSYEQSA